jgi:hypothetical protein
MTLTILKTRIIVVTPAIRTARTYDLQSGGSCLDDLPTRHPASVARSSVSDGLCSRLSPRNWRRTMSQTEHHSSPPSSRSPSGAIESAPVAEYHEWPFQSFLERTKIRDDVQSRIPITMYLARLNQPIDCEALDISLNRELSARRTF